MSKQMWKNLWVVFFLALFVADNTQAAVPPSQEVVLGQVETLKPGTPLEQRVLTVDFNNMPIQEAMRAIALQQDINIVVDPKVEGLVSIHLDELPFEKGLSYILETVNAEFKKDGLVYKVNPKKESKEPLEAIVPYTFERNEDRVTIKAKEVDLKTILNDLAQQFNLNISYDSSIRGVTSLYIENLPAIKALQTIIESNGFSLKKNEGVYYVSRQAQQEKSNINVVDGKVWLQSSGEQIKDVLMKLSIQSGISIVTSGYVEGVVNAVIQGKTIEEAIKLILIGTSYQFKEVKGVYVIGNGDSLETNSLLFVTTEVIKLKYVRAEEIIKKLPSTFPQANIQFIENQNAIAVSGSDDLVKTIKDFLEKLDKPIPQIKVDVLVVEYDEDVNKTFGLNLTDVNAKGFGSKSTSLDYDPAQTNTLFFSYDMAQSLSEAFQINLQALIAEGKARLYANPSIWALNGNEASLDVVTQDRFRELVFNEATGRLEPVGVPRTIESGVKLRIKPWISGDEEITIEIEPEVSNATGALSTDDLPQTTQRKAKTVLKVKNGRTIILGGMIQTTYQNDVSRTPVLSSIPILGAAFENKSRQERKTELVFYITPTIAEHLVPGEDVSENVLGQSLIQKDWDEQEKEQSEQEWQQESQEQQVSLQPQSPYTELSTNDWMYQETGEDIGSIRRKRVPLINWKQYKEKVEKENRAATLKEKVSEQGWSSALTNGPEDGLGYQVYVTAPKLTDQAVQQQLIAQYDKQVEEILKSEKELVGQFDEQDL